MKKTKTPESFIHDDGMGQIIVTKYKENCYVANSHKKPVSGNRRAVNSTVSYIYYAGGNKTAEWCPTQNSPISVNTKCQPTKFSREDLFLGTATNDWSQLAVDEHRLNELAVYNIDEIFNVLKKSI